jgi:hypothetical protein
MRKFISIILLVATFGSLISVLYAGRNAPVILSILFIGWVISPFISLILINFVSKLKKNIESAILHLLILLISFFSLLCYTLAFFLHTNKPPTGIFLIVPFLSWILIVLIIIISVYKRRRLK